MLFVYGTLKRGYVNDLTGKACFMQTISTAPKFELRDLGDYPGMTHGVSSVRGELWDISLRELWKLDDFEECPSLFLRKSIQLIDSSFAEAYIIVPQHIKAANLILSW